MKAPTGARVSLYYDSPREVNTGDYLQTTSGRLYWIDKLRRQTKGRRVGRWHIKAIVVDEAQPGAVIHPIYWYRRKSKHERR